MSRSSRWSIGAVGFVIVMAILGALVERATHRVVARIDGQFGYTPDPAGTQAFLAELDQPLFSDAAKDVIKNAKQRKGDAAEPAASLSSTLTDIAAGAPGPEASGSTDKKPHAKHRRADSQELSPPVAVEPPNTRIPTYRQGDRCRVGDKHGVVQFVGTIPTLGQGVWCGIQFDEPVGTCNGRIGDRYFFKCPSNHGGFHRPSELAFELITAGAPAAAEKPKASEPADTQGRRGERADEKKKKKKEAVLEPVAVERAPAATVLPDPSKDPTVPQTPSRALASKCKCDGRGLQWALVNQAAQHRKQAWSPVYLVQDHQLVQVTFQIQLSLGQLSAIPFGFQVEIDVRYTVSHFQCQRGFAHLAGPEQGHGR
jgi:hypothetical protein